MASARNFRVTETQRANSDTFEIPSIFWVLAMKTLKFSQKIVITASLVTITAFAAFALFNDYRQRSALQSDLDASLREVGGLAANNIESWLDGRIQLVESLGQRLAVSGADIRTLPQSVGLPVYGANFQLTFFGGQDGLMYSVPSGTRAADYDPRTRGWYKAAQATNASIVTEPYIAASSGKLVITVATPVRVDKQLIGVAAADMGLDVVTEVINSLQIKGAGHAFLVTGEGKLLVHPNKEFVLSPIERLFPGDVPKIKDGTFLVKPEDGVARYISFKKIQGVPSTDWYVGLVLDEKTAFAMLDESRASALVAGITAVVLSLLIIGLVIRALMRPLRAMGRAMEAIASGDGDLTKRLSIDTHDEFGELASAFNRFVARIHSSIQQVSLATDSLNDVTRLVVSASTSSLKSSDDQAHRTNSVAAAINQLGASAQQIARNAADASQGATGALQQAEKGRDVVNKTMGTMKELSEKVSAASVTIETLNGRTVDIGHILEVIRSISEQTNLLALNAAIEAARAGDAGRGFAVVADEVRSLAHRTQSSAREIQSMIEELQVGSREAVTIMTESQRYSDSSVSIAQHAGEHLASVTQQIDEIDGMNQSVAAATEEQTAVIEALNVDIVEINTLNQQGVLNLQATLHACGDLENQAERLKLLVGNFRI